jgi:hypothetical protein
MRIFRKIESRFPGRSKITREKSFGPALTSLLVASQTESVLGIPCTIVTAAGRRNENAV